jgi:hypothetical protein
MTSEFAFSAKVGFKIARIRDGSEACNFILGFPLRTNSDSPAASEGTMRPKKHETTGEEDLFRGGSIRSSV